MGFIDGAGYVDATHSYVATNKYSIFILCSYPDLYHYLIYSTSFVTEEEVKKITRVLLLTNISLMVGCLKLGGKPMTTFFYLLERLSTPILPLSLRCNLGWPYV